MKKIFIKIAKVLVWIIAGITVCVVGIIIFLWVNSPSTTDPITDVNGKIPSKSIARIEKIKLRGTDQYLIIRGADSTKPVMLYLHGGPGGPEMAFIKEKNQAIENDFLMVYWEQYGAGKSYSKNLSPDRIVISQFVLDTKELSEILIKRFKQKKIFLMGHSWGSLLGMCTINEFPQLYYGYFGIGQIGNQYKGEEISFNWVKEQAKLNNDSKACAELSKLMFPTSSKNNVVWEKFMSAERSYVLKYGGGFEHNKSSSWPIMKTILLAKEYSLAEKMNANKACQYTVRLMWHEILDKNLFQEIDSIQIPVFIFQGKYDYQTPHDLAKAFFDHLKAPHKEFFTFNNSAHSPIVEEVNRFDSLLRIKSQQVLRTFK
jgi:pimeloyl-ACP methyl ester carboxylesterase